MDLKFRVGKVTLDNPVIAAAGTHGRDGSTVRKIAAASGVGAVTTKTINTYPSSYVRPFLAPVRGGLLNCSIGSMVPARKWWETEMKTAKAGGAKVIANVAGRDVVDVAKAAEQAGADMIELSTHCAHMKEVLETINPKLQLPSVQTGPAQAEIFARDRVAAVKAAVTIPVIVKLAAVTHVYASEWARLAVDAGADAIGCADALGPVMSIDIETGQPVLGGPFGGGGLTGAALKPIALRMVFDVSRTVKVPIIGVGGISDWKDAIEYFMAGASAVGVCTAAHLKGPGVYKKILSGIEGYMRDKGYKGLQDIVGLAHKRVAERREQGKAAVTVPQPPTVLEGLCSDCGLCVDACVFEAIRVEDSQPKIDASACYGCGLCVRLCPKKALALDYFA